MKKNIIAFILASTAVIFLLQCNKKTGESEKGLVKHQTPLNFSFGISNGRNVQFKQSPEAPLISASRPKNQEGKTALKVSSCGYGFGRSYAGSGYYVYPYDTLELSYTPAGTAVNLYVTSYDVPNRFTIYNATTGSIVANSSWMGFATYAGPWGQSLNTPQTGTLTFSKTSSNDYYLKVETSVSGISDAYSATIGCPSPTPQVTTIAFQNAAITNTMTSSFTGLTGVNFAALSSELGLSSTLTINDINFVQLYKSYINNDNDSGYAVIALFKNYPGFAYALASNGSVYTHPTIVKTTSTVLKYFDLDFANIATITNYKTSNYTITQSYGNYQARRSVGCGQGTSNCIADAYTNHGWVSVFATVVTAFIPHTALAISGACAIKNCIR